MRKFGPLAVALFLPMPVMADGNSGRPASCQLVATAQYDDCSIKNTFRCSGENFAFWIEILDADAALTIETRNASHGSMSVTYVGQGASFQLSQSQTNPRDIISNGSAEDIVVGVFEVFGMRRPITYKTSYGYAGETSEIAGETFARIALAGSLTLPPPMTEIAGGGTLLFSDRLDLLVEEEFRFDSGIDRETSRLSLLSLPGQPGFGDETPGFGCGELSRLSLPRMEIPA